MFGPLLERIANTQPCETYNILVKLTIGCCYNLYVQSMQSLVDCEYKVLHINLK